MLFFVLFKDKILDINIPSHGKSYVISDIEWFCRTINDLFNTETRLHRKNEQILQQFKHTIGGDIHLIYKRDFKKLNINGDEVFIHLYSFYHLSFCI